VDNEERSSATTWVDKGGRHQRRAGRPPSGKGRREKEERERGGRSQRRFKLALSRVNWASVTQSHRLL
jgi:hypothetical protein